MATKTKRRAKRKVPSKTPQGAATSRATLRAQLVQRRLDMLALFRSLDRLGLMQDLPLELRDLFELDADFAEALHVLDQPSKRFDMVAMRRDTMASLASVPVALNALLALLDGPARLQLLACFEQVRAGLVLSDAYLQIPGRDPTVA
jgi:hypothetical protein